MAEYQGNSSTNVPHRAAEQTYTGSKEHIEPQDVAGKPPLDPALRQGAMVSQVPLPPYMKLANPGPLGLLSFAITTFVLGLYECGAGYIRSLSTCK